MSGVWEKEHVVLYTKQKVQKSKKWHDGKVKVKRERNKFKLTVISEEGEIIESRVRDEDVENGSEIELGSILLQVEDVIKPYGKTKGSGIDLAGKMSQAGEGEAKQQERQPTERFHGVKRKLGSAQRTRAVEVTAVELPAEGRTDAEIIRLLRDSMEKGEPTASQDEDVGVEDPGVKFPSDQTRRPRLRQKTVDGTGGGSIAETRTLARRIFVPPRTVRTDKSAENGEKGRSGSSDVRFSFQAPPKPITSALWFPNPWSPYAQKRQSRSTKIADSFNDVRDYCNTFRAALYEEVNLQLQDLSRRLFKLLEQIGGGPKGTVLREVGRAAGRSGIRLYTNVSVSARIVDRSGTRRRFLNFESAESGRDFSRDDLWILFDSSVLLQSNPASDPPIFFFKSLFFGVSTQGSLELDPIDTEPPSGFGTDSGKIVALRGPDVQTELSVLRTLETQGVELKRLQALQAILGRCADSQTASEADSAGTTGDGKSSLTEIDELNESQTKTLQTALQLVAPGVNDRIGDRMLLLHGPFGTGKTHTIVALLTTLLDPPQEMNLKVLIAATTNVAVDNILRGLSSKGFDRVKRIHKSLLSKTLLSGKKSEEIADLSSLIKNNDGSAEELSAYRSLLEELKTGRREKLLDEACVVGSTCASLVSPQLASMKGKFDLLIVDEASQMIEPQTLVPILFAGHDATILLAGDPQQLPPTLGGGSDDAGFGLGKALMTRLLRSPRHIPVMFLDTQYRCHPSISQISNRLFYDSRLKDGVTEGDRPPLIRNLAPVVFVNMQDADESYSKNGSYSNTKEVDIIVSTLRLFSELLENPGDAGVICSYKSQAQAISSTLERQPDLAAAVQVSTVDAFQGAERDIICFSTVRNKSIGNLLTSRNRVNVALTRAKSHLIIFGNDALLKKNQLWRAVIGMSQSKSSAQWREFLTAARE